MFFFFWKRLKSVRSTDRLQSPQSGTHKNVFQKTITPISWTKSVINNGAPFVKKKKVRVIADTFCTETAESDRYHPSIVVQDRNNSESAKSDRWRANKITLLCSNPEAPLLNAHLQ